MSPNRTIHTQSRRGASPYPQVPPPPEPPAFLRGRLAANPQASLPLPRLSFLRSLHSIPDVSPPPPSPPLPSEGIPDALPPPPPSAPPTVASSSRQATPESDEEGATHFESSPSTSAKQDPSVPRSRRLKPGMPSAKVLLARWHKAQDELHAVKRELAEFKDIEEANCELALELEDVKGELACAQERCTKFQKSLSGMQWETSCGVCGHQMTSAVILECGHSFCGSCVYTWFRTKLDDHILQYPHYDPRSFVPEQWITALQNEGLSWVARLSLVSNIDASLLSSHHPCYTCPSCRQHIRNAPVPNVALKQVARGLSESLGEEHGPNDGVRDALTWEDLFPISVRQLGLVWYVVEIL